MLCQACSSGLLCMGSLPDLSGATIYLTGLIVCLMPLFCGIASQVLARSKGLTLSADQLKVRCLEHVESPNLLH